MTLVTSNCGNISECIRWGLQDKVLLTQIGNQITLWKWGFAKYKGNSVVYLNYLRQLEC